MSIGHRFAAGPAAAAAAAARRFGLAALALAAAVGAFTAPTAAADTANGADAAAYGRGPAAAGANTPRPQVSAGDLVYSGSGTLCRAELNARSGNTYYLILPGHCTQGTSAWYTTAALTTYIGPTVATSFPGNDYGLVRYDNPAVPHPGNGFTSAGGAYIGEPVCRRTTVTGVHCGVVTGLNATVNYAGGVVSGLIATNVCAEPGDTGGVLYSGTTALGLFVGGSGNCTKGGTSYYQPITEVLAAYGLSLY